jgi:hypothetical protein
LKGHWCVINFLPSIFLYRSRVLFLFSHSQLYIFLTLPSLQNVPYFTMSESQSQDATEHDHHNGLIIPDLSGAVPTSSDARAKRRIAALEEELQMIKQERRHKQRFVVSHYFPPCLVLIDPQRKTTYYVAQGRAIRRMAVLYNSLEDLIAENDRRYEENLEDGLVQNTNPE